MAQNTIRAVHRAMHPGMHPVGVVWAQANCLRHLEAVGRWRLVWIVTWVAIWTLCARPTVALAQAAPPATAQTTGLDPAAMQAELQRLDGVCATLGLELEREIMRQWLVEPATDAHIYYLPLPTDPSSLWPRKSSGAGTAAPHNSVTKPTPQHAAWLKHFSKARTGHAQYWFQQAREHAASGDEWQAYLELWHAAREDSQQADTRRVLGPLLAGLAIKGRPRPVTTPHTKFGWAAGSYQRLETNNFKITSRSDPEQTLAIAQRLENFYALWTQAFYPLWAAPNVVSSRLAGRNTPWSRRIEIDVVICRDREDYLKTLGVSEANIGVSVGYYHPEMQTSFFYPDEELETTLYHELTHQLLAEASQVKQGTTAGQESDFWLVEATALYMESLVSARGHWRLGGWLSPRLQAARYRGLGEGFWMPLDQLQALNLSTWKDQQDIGKVYTHVAGLAHFFLDRRLPAVETELTNLGHEPGAVAGREHLNAYDADQSRAAFFRALVACYSGQAVGTELWQLMGTEPQSAYVHFLLVRDRHLQSLARDVQGHACQELVVARSRLTSQSWEVLGSLEQLRWLDLSFSNARDENLKSLQQLMKVERLSLEGLSLDAEKLGWLKSLANLKELDLSGCELVSGDLLQLGKLPMIEVLWLSNNPVSDEAMSWLRSLPRLQHVTLDGTQVTAPAIEELNRYLQERSKSPGRQ